MAIKQPDINLLWAKSGNQCAKCKAPLVVESPIEQSTKAEQAHVAGEKKGSARHIADMDGDERSSYSNLILLCPSCHTEIDKQRETFTIERLLAIKNSHENDIAEAIKAGGNQLTFFELEDTLRHLINSDVGEVEESLDLIPPKEKIDRNQLGTKVESMLATGFFQAKDVGDFLNKNVDMDYESRLRKAFVAKYREIRFDYKLGDDAFYALLAFASNNNSNPRYMAAGLSVLAYYFQICEVFEK